MWISVNGKMINIGTATKICKAAYNDQDIEFHWNGSEDCTHVAEFKTKNARDDAFSKIKALLSSNQGVNEL